MTITSQLKAWLVANCGTKETATDVEFRQAAAGALASGKLTAVEFVKLTTVEEKEVSGFDKKMTSIADSIEKLATALTPKEAGGTDEAAKAAAAKKVADAKALADKGGAEGGSKANHPAWLKMMRAAIGTTAELDGDQIDVKAAHENYSTTKSALSYPGTDKKGRPHPRAGQPVMDFDERGRALDNPSDRDKAVAGAYAQFMVLASKSGSKTLAWIGLPQHQKELLQFALNECNWGGGLSSDAEGRETISNRKLTPHERKAVIDDAVSGGLEAAPIVFDDMVITTPYLNGELYPWVNVIPLDRGRRVEGVATGQVTGSWGGVDDTTISLFNTASYISAFDTTIFRWEGAVQIGLDFLSDTPIDFGAHFTQQYGEALLEDLDDVIAVGNGTTQPEGIMNKSGATSVSFGGTTTLGNYESLRFGVAKKEHKANVAGSAVFCGTETSYQRARAIPVGASDARRLGGMDYSSYQWMERPYKINESLTNAQIFYAILKRYRMYRRRGLTIRTTTEGSTLMLKNEMLIVVTARYGGQMERGGCVAKTTTAPV